MDITQKIAELKKRADFSEHVGMILIHNGVVRNWSRNSRAEVTRLEVQPDYQKIEQLRQEFLGHTGIYEIVIDAKSGLFSPGDDLLYIIVAGDIRENVKKVLAELLDKIKAEAIDKKEILL